MADLMLNNLDASTSDDEIRDFLAKYGFPPFDRIEHIPGDGSHPAVLITFKDATPEFLRRLEPRIHDIFWKNRRLQVTVLQPFG